MNKIVQLLVLILLLSVNVSASDFITTNFASDTITIYENSKRYDLFAGDGPNKVVVNNDLAFVSNTINDSVTVVNLTSKEIIKEIKVGNNPIGLAIGNNLLYVANSGQESVSVVDLTTLEKIASITVEDTPVDLVLRSDGTLLYVTNLASNSISVVSTQENQVINTISYIKTLTSPAAIEITPNNDFIYILDTKENKIVKIDANKYNILPESIRLPNVNINNDLILGNKYALVSGNVNGTGVVSIIDLEENKIIDKIEFADEVFGIDFDGNDFYIAKKNQVVQKYSIDSKTSEEFSVGEEPRGVKIIGKTTKEVTPEKTINWKKTIFWIIVLILLLMIIRRRKKKEKVYEEKKQVKVEETKKKKVIAKKQAAKPQKTKAEAKPKQEEKKNEAPKTNPAEKVDEPVVEQKQKNDQNPQSEDFY